MTDAFDPALGHLLRDLAPQVLGALARRHDDFGAAEDAVQEALIAAAAQWPREGTPTNPRGWLYHVAMRRLTDRVRSDAARRSREESVAAEMAAESSAMPSTEVEDDGGGVTAQVEEAVSLGGAGIAGMRERIAQLKGRFEIGDAGGRGVRMRALLPLSQERRQQEREPA